MKDGMFYAPKGKENKVVKDGEFVFGVIGLDHGHIYGMSQGLIDAGANMKCVFDPDPAKVEKFVEKFPQAKVCSSKEEVLNDPELSLIASACITNERAPLGIEAMKAGKHYFVDKAPMTTLEQLAAVKEACAQTGKKFGVCYSERLMVEAAVYAGKLIEDGKIGKVIQVLGLGPHRLNNHSRPDWFYNREQYGGILCDIGSHQIEQFLYYTGATDAVIANSKIGNFNNPEHIQLDDFGDATLIGNNGATGYFRVDWFTPDGLSTWGDGRMFILGTEGYIEMRKYADIAKEATENHVYLVNGDGEFHIDATNTVGFPFFADFVLDCINGTENAMTAEHTFKAAELCIKAQMQAIELTGRKEADYKL